MKISISAAFLVAAVAASAFAVPGCGREVGVPKDASPVVSAESDRAKKALAEQDKANRVREAQEAKARRRTRGGLPGEG